VIDKLLYDNRAMIVKISEVANAVARSNMHTNSTNQSMVREFDQDLLEANPELKEIEFQLSFS